MFQRHAPYYNEARAGSVAFAEIGVSPGVRNVFPSQKEAQDFIVSTFLVPKKDGGSRPILDLHLLNHTLQIYRVKIDIQA